jgi:hypothetical protein
MRILALAIATLAASLYMLYSWVSLGMRDGDIFNLGNLSSTVGNERLYSTSHIPVLIFGTATDLVPLLSLVTTLGSVAILYLKYKRRSRFIRSLAILVSILVLWQAFALAMFHFS